MEKLFDFKQKKALKNREIFIKCRGILIRDTSLISKYCDIEKVEIACKSGCVNYGKKWSCPPYARKFTSLSAQYSKAILLVFSTETKYYLDIKNKYTAIKAANVTLKTYIEKCARSIEESIDGYSLLSGSCRLCKKCACKVEEKCRKPEKMRYSLEATGIDVVQMCNDLLGFKLLWYTDKTLPEYTSTVSMIMFNDDKEKEEIVNVVLDVINK